MQQQQNVAPTHCHNWHFLQLCYVRSCLHYDAPRPVEFSLSRLQSLCEAFLKKISQTSWIGQFSISPTPKCHNNCSKLLQHHQYNSGQLTQQTQQNLGISEMRLVGHVRDEYSSKEQRRPFYIEAGSCHERRASCHGYWIWRDFLVHLNQIFPYQLRTKKPNMGEMSGVGCVVSDKCQLPCSYLESC